MNSKLVIWKFIILFEKKNNIRRPITRLTEQWLRERFCEVIFFKLSCCSVILYYCISISILILFIFYKILSKYFMAESNSIEDRKLKGINKCMEKMWVVLEKNGWFSEDWSSRHRCWNRSRSCQLPIVMYACHDIRFRII